MNWAPPSWLQEAYFEAHKNDVMVHHYAHPRGRPRLLKAISKHYSPQFENLVKEGRELKPEEIVVTAGANGGEPNPNTTLIPTVGRNGMLITTLCL
jgi:kynurenine aminotransferase